jgi:hypothetical protein
MHRAAEVLEHAVSQLESHRPELANIQTGAAGRGGRSPPGDRPKISRVLCIMTIFEGSFMLTLICRTASTHWNRWQKLRERLATNT